MNPVIETERLILREFTMEDLSAWHAILSDEETMQHYPAPFDLARTTTWMQRNLEYYPRLGFGLWAVVLKETGELIGDCGITLQNIHHDGNLLPEIGYHIDKHFWRKGYASEAASACLNWVFTHTTYEEIYSYQKYTNIASRKVAEKMGMTFREEYADETNTKTSVYSMTKSEYLARQ